MVVGLVALACAAAPGVAAAAAVSCGGTGTFTVDGTTVTASSPDCSGTITIPAGVTAIASPTQLNPGVFENRPITSVSLPSSLTSIGDRAFAQSPGHITLTTVTFAPPSGSLTIGARAFYQTDALTGIVLPSGVTSIGDEAFLLSGIASITIPSTVTTIGDGTFSSAQSLGSVVVPNSVTSIGSGAFYNSGVASVTLPSGLTTIESNLFGSTVNLTSLTIPSGVTSIGDDAFNGSGVLSLDLPSGVTSIGDHAFEDTGITTITIPAGVAHLGDNAFSGSAVASIMLPDGVTPLTIGNNAFSGTSNLTRLVLPDRVTDIGEGAFDSSGVTSITLPTNPLFTALRPNLFNAADQLASLTIPASVTDIYQYALYGDALRDVWFLGDPPTLIDADAFDHYLSGSDPGVRVHALASSGFDFTVPTPSAPEWEYTSGQAQPLYLWLATPGAPTAAAGESSATVSWSTVAGAERYTVTAVEDPTRQCVWTSGPLRCVITGLTNGTAYTFTVIADSTSTRGVSQESGPSNAVTPGAPPPPTPAAATTSTPAATPAADAGAPILRAVITPSRRTLRFGQQVTLHLNVRNVGTAGASGVTACVAIPSGFELVDAHGGTHRRGEVCYIVGTLTAPVARRNAVRVSTRDYRVTLRAMAARTTGFAITVRADNATARRFISPLSRVRVTPGRPLPVVG